MTRKRSNGELCSFRPDTKYAWAKSRAAELQVAELLDLERGGYTFSYSSGIVDLEHQDEHTLVLQVRIRCLRGGVEQRLPRISPAEEAALEAEAEARRAFAFLAAVIDHERVAFRFVGGDKWLGDLGDLRDRTAQPQWFRLPPGSPGFLEEVRRGGRRLPRMENEDEEFIERATGRKEEETPKAARASAQRARRLVVPNVRPPVVGAPLPGGDAAARASGLRAADRRQAAAELEGAQSAASLRDPAFVLVHERAASGRYSYVEDANMDNRRRNHDVRNRNARREAGDGDHDDAAVRVAGRRRSGAGVRRSSRSRPDADDRIVPDTVDTEGVPLDDGTDGHAARFHHPAAVPVQVTRRSFDFERDWAERGVGRALCEDSAARAIAVNEGLPEGLDVRAIPAMLPDGSTQIHIVSSDENALENMERAVASQEIHLVVHPVPKPTPAQMGRAVASWGQGWLLPPPNRVPARRTPQSDDGPDASRSRPRRRRSR